MNTSVAFAHRESEQTEQRKEEGESHIQTVSELGAGL